ncbi:putative enzyme related to lactoylglutathione lyase [Amycolatopsis umgeniensis]|uniref:Putative enzyme related to lactoylglutathione lyase n=1 Tax=Amycolatopsis umgeniensis TaxID=336628 RepID=A0A841ATM9_9PSEU|nr:VOC family protein [Amycolatopsis umgeniensis]MBB5852189.1 putative enzyme related to lactoylglutathione lyase [Amycolatopsis umgeniensis]
MTVTGLDFLSLQVRDLDRAAEFYETQLGLSRLPVAPPHAVVFGTETIPFAVREPVPGMDLDAVSPGPGSGVALWLHADDAQLLHDRLAEAGTPIVTEPFDGPFGRTFAFSDPDGYVITIHDKA